VNLDGSVYDPTDAGFAASSRSSTAARPTRSRWCTAGSTGASEVIYLPGGSVNFSHADEDTEMVYVANPPSVYADHLAAAAGDSSGN